MATRFRLPSSGTAAVSPALTSYGHVAASPVRRPLPLTDSSALTTVAYTPDGSDHLVAGDAFHAQFVSDEMNAGIVFSTGDTVEFAIQGLEAHASNNLFIQFWAGVYSADGNTLRATLRSEVTDATELGTALASRYHSANLSSGYTTQAGDRLVVEFGVVGTPTAAGGVQGHNASLRWGSDGAGGDLSTTEGATGTTLNPWVEFSTNITFPIPPVTLTVHKATHAQAAEEPALIQQNVLAINDALHAQAAEEPVLTQANTLAPDEAVHAQTAEAPALVQANVLAPDDAGQAQAAESPTVQYQAPSASLVQTASNTNVDTLSFTISMTPTVGSALILPVISGGPSTVVTVSDNQGNSWGRVVNRNFLAGIYGVELWRAENVAGAATIVTVARNTSGALSAILSEVSGLASNAFDKSAIASSTTGTTTPSSGSTPTTTQADEFVIGFGVISVSGGEPTVTEAVNFTTIDVESGYSVDMTMAAYRVVSATGQYQYNPTLSIAKGYNLGVATFKTATGPASLVVADAAHAQAAEEPTLVQQNTLVVDDAAQAQSVESPTLDVGAVLAPDDAAQAQLADHVTLTQQNTLAVADALHGHTADNVALVQQNILAVADALHALSSESPSLVQAYLLAVQDALHGHTADNVALTQANVLAVLDALHGHTAESPSLIQANILAVLDALHGHLADNVDLTQQNLLVVHDAAHDLFFDNVILELQGFLGVQDSRHVHLTDNVALTQQQILAVQDALHALSSESPTPTVAFLLVVNDAVHALLGESPVLSQAHVLAVQDALHLHTADNASVQVAYVLVPQDALHSLSSESPLLTIQFALTVQDAFHALTSDMVIVGTLIAIPIKVGGVRAGPLVSGDVRTGAIIRGQGRVGPNIDLGVRS